jgi:polar amino acid transport system substrate-binding protein
MMRTVKRESVYLVRERGRFRFWPAFLAVVLLIFAHVGVSAATENESALTEPDTLVFVTGDRYPPFTGRDLPEDGLFTVMMNEIYALAGRPVAVRFRPWRRATFLTEKGVYDGTFPYIHTSRRAERFFFSDPVFHSRQRLLVLRASGLVPDTVEDLAGLSYCNPRGYTTRTGLEELARTGRIRRWSPPSMRACIEMLDEERVDFVPIGLLQGRRMVREIFDDPSRVRVVDVGLPDDRLYVMFPRSQPRGRALRDEFNALLKRARESGRLRTVFNRYLSRHNLMPIR